MSASAHPIALTIAGSEATGGAGAQADLRTFQARDVFGAVALTCIVSFDPKHDWDHRFVPVDPQVLRDQLEAQFACFQPDAVKIGMLGTPATIDVVAQALSDQQVPTLVLDPVLICKGQEPGAALDTDNALKAQILPLASFVTPNQFEAMILADMDEISTPEHLEQAARIIHEKSGAAVLAKGGVRLDGPDAIDVFYDGSQVEVLSTAKVGEVAVSGAGCSLAAAITAELAKGASALDAAKAAKQFVTDGIRARLETNAPFASLRQLNS